MNDNAMAAGILGMVAIGCLVLFLLLLVPAVMYCLTLKRALERIAPERRELEPGMVWLLLIPLVGLVWHFFVVFKLTPSFRKEFEARGLTTDDPQFGQTIGLVMCICPLAAWVPLLGLLAGLAGLVFWILWWVKVAGYSRQLA